MSQDRDRMHVQPAGPHPGPPPAAAGDQDQAGDYAAVRVHVTNTVVTDAAAAFGHYFTVTIPASPAGGPATVAQLLPADPRRRAAYLLPIDYPVAISTSLAEAQGATVGATLPAGLGPGWSPPITHPEAVWAANTSTAGPCRVVVMSESAGP